MRGFVLGPAKSQGFSIPVCMLMVALAGVDRATAHKGVAADD